MVTGSQNKIKFLNNIWILSSVVAHICFLFFSKLTIRIMKMKKRRGEGEGGGEEEEDKEEYGLCCTVTLPIDGPLRILAPQTRLSRIIFKNGSL